MNNWLWNYLKVEYSITLFFTEYHENGVSSMRARMPFVLFTVEVLVLDTIHDDSRPAVNVCWINVRVVWNRKFQKSEGNFFLNDGWLYHCKTWILFCFCLKWWQMGRYEDFEWLFLSVSLLKWWNKSVFIYRLELNMSLKTNVTRRPLV